MTLTPAIVTYHSRVKLKENGKIYPVYKEENDRVHLFNNNPEFNNIFWIHKNHVVPCNEDGSEIVEKIGDYRCKVCGEIAMFKHSCGERILDEEEKGFGHWEKQKPKKIEYIEVTNGMQVRVLSEKFNEIIDAINSLTQNT